MRADNVLPFCVLAFLILIKYTESQNAVVKKCPVMCRKFCFFGFVEKDGCPICKCKRMPQKDKRLCPRGRSAGQCLGSFECPFGFYCKRDNPRVKKAGVCCRSDKPGCPMIPAGMTATCKTTKEGEKINSCGGDRDCPAGNLCCKGLCGRYCRKPVLNRPPSIRQEVSRSDPTTLDLADMVQRIANPPGNTPGAVNRAGIIRNVVDSIISDQGADGSVDTVQPVADLVKPDGTVSGPADLVQGVVN